MTSLSKSKSQLIDCLNGTQFNKEVASEKKQSVNGSFSYRVQLPDTPDNVLETELFEVEILARYPNGVSGVLRQAQMVQPFHVVCLSAHPEKIRYHVWFAGETYWLEQTALVKKTGRSKAAQPLDVSGSSHIESPMPGTVLQVLVKQGDIVSPKQPVVLMESMKMEMALSSPVAAKVEKILCQPNQLVAMNAVLVELSPITEESGS